MTYKVVPLVKLELCEPQLIYLSNGGLTLYVIIQHWVKRGTQKKTDNPVEIYSWPRGRFFLWDL